MRRRTAWRREEVTEWAADVANIGLAKEAECRAVNEVDGKVADKAKGAANDGAVDEVTGSATNDA